MKQSIKELQVNWAIKIKKKRKKEKKKEKKEKSNWWAKVDLWKGLRQRALWGKHLPRPFKNTQKKKKLNPKFLSTNSWPIPCRKHKKRMSLLPAINLLRIILWKLDIVLISKCVQKITISHWSQQGLILCHVLSKRQPRAKCSYCFSSIRPDSRWHSPWNRLEKSFLSTRTSSKMWPN